MDDHIEDPPTVAPDARGRRAAARRSDTVGAATTLSDESPTRKRRRDGARNDERILEAAQRDLLAAGADGVSLSRVARSAGVSPAALYARFDDAADLVATLWEVRYRHELHRYVHAVVGALVSDSGHTDDGGAENAIIDSCARLLTGPSRDLLAAGHLVMTSAHLPELRDIVPRDLNLLVSDLGAGPDRADDDRLAPLLALSIALGALIVPVPSTVEDWSEVVRLMRHLIRHPGAAAGELDLHTVPIQVEAMTGLQRDILDAAIGVVGEVGVHRATISRIARRAGVAPSRIYAIARNRSELVQSFIPLLIPRVQPYDVLGGDSAARLASRLASWMTPGNRPFRRFVIAVYGAAFADSLLHDGVTDLLDRTDALNEEATGSTDRIVRRAASLVSSTGRLVGNGLLTLHEVSIHDPSGGLGLERLDFSPSFRALDGANAARTMAAVLGADAVGR